MPSLSPSASRSMLNLIFADLNTLMSDVRAGEWNLAIDKHLCEISETFKARCDVRDAGGKPIGYTDDSDPFADVTCLVLREVVREVYAYRPPDAPPVINVAPAAPVVPAQAVLFDVAPNTEKGPGHL